MESYQKFKTQFQEGNWVFQPAVDPSSNSMGVRIINVVTGTVYRNDVVSQGKAFEFLESVRAGFA